MPGESVNGVKCGNHIINCARGGIINEDDLLTALDEGIIASAALDVLKLSRWQRKQISSASNFHSIHIGAATVEAQKRVGLDIVRNIMTILSGKKSEFVVNKQYLK